VASDDETHSGEWLTVKEIAEDLRLNPATIRSWIAAGTLDARRAGKRKWLVQRAEIDRMLAEEGLAGRDNLTGAQADEILPPHQSPHWPAEAIEHVGRTGWFQFQSAYWHDTLVASALTTPDQWFAFRLSAIASAMASKAAAISNLQDEDPGPRWHEQTGLPGGVLSPELSPDANRPGSVARWEPFDAAVRSLDRAMAQHDLTAEGEALEALAVLMHDLVDDVIDLGYPWPETTRPLPGLVSKPRDSHYGPADPAISADPD
jgi:excisionase family DNA binding protein